jgi:transcriptional regulator with XRE-family HTH domain
VKVEACEDIGTPPNRPERFWADAAFDFPFDGHVTLQQNKPRQPQSQALKTLQTFGRRLRKLRRAKNLGQRASAERVGVRFSDVSRVENENQGPVPQLRRVKPAQAFDVNPAELPLPKKIPEPVRPADRNLALTDLLGLGELLAGRTALELGNGAGLARPCREAISDGPAAALPPARPRRPARQGQELPSRCRPGSAVPDFNIL